MNVGATANKHGAEATFASLVTIPVAIGVLAGLAGFLLSKLLALWPVAATRTNRIGLLAVGVLAGVVSGSLYTFALRQSSGASLRQTWEHLEGVVLRVFCFVYVGYVLLEIARRLV